MRTKKPSSVRQPGEQPQTEVEPTAVTEPGQSNVDEAIDLAKSGKARKIAKAKPVVPPSKVKGDPDRPAAAPVNHKREMSYAEAMELLEAGKLTRSVLTEKGWVAAPNKRPPAGPQPTE